MTRVYPGFAHDLEDLLGRRMEPLAKEYGDDWQAAAALVPGIDAKFRDQCAVEHLVHCIRRRRARDEARGDLPDPKRGRAQPQKALLERLGVTSGQVKAWAVGTGLLTEIKRGQVGVDVIELYALAHDTDLSAPDPAKGMVD